MKKSKFYFLCCFVLMCVFSSCVYALDDLPYQISGEMVINSDTGLDGAGTQFDFVFSNKSVKNITSFTVVFYLFDEDGNPVMNGRANVVATVNQAVESGEKIEGSFSLDKYVSVIPSEPYLVDYLYVSKIKYEDGSIWSDSFGLHAK